MLEMICVMFSWTNNPIMLMVMLFIMTLVASYKMYEFTNIFIMSMVLLIVLVGGLMILFLYMVSLQPSFKITISYSKMLISLFIYFILSSPIWYSQNLNSSKLTQMYENSVLCLLLISYLFLSMICVMHIVNQNKYPIREIYEKYYNNIKK